MRALTKEASSLSGLGSKDRPFGKGSHFTSRRAAEVSAGSASSRSVDRRRCTSTWCQLYRAAGHPRDIGNGQASPQIGRGVAAGGPSASPPDPSMVICTAHRCPMLRRVYPPFPPSVSAQVTNGLSALSKQDEVIALRLLSPPPSLPPPLHQPG